MLTKIAIFNTKKHTQAILTLDKNSIQLVGENQIGKTTLIDTLNFLYVIKPQNMFFDNGKYTFSQTIEHLFPTEQHSYIIFENYKKEFGFFCILVKRKANEVEYYKINMNFENLLPIIKSDTKIRSFNEIQEELITASGLFEEIDRLKLFKLVYSNDLTKNAVVWINNNVNRKGQSLENSFTKVYRFLINSKLISAETLKEALIIANDRKNTILKVFADKSKKENIAKLKKIQQDIERFSDIKPLFEDFKAIVELYKSKKELTGNLFFTFREYHNQKLIELDTIIRSASTKTEIIQKELDNEENGLEIQKTQLAKETGFLESQIKTKKEEIEKSNEILREIDLINVFNVPTEQLLKQFEEDKKRKEVKLNEINYYLTSADKQLQNNSSEKIRQNILKQKNNLNQLQNQSKSYNDLLKFNITTDNVKQKFLNNLLSDKVLNLHKKFITKSIENFEDELLIFDGKIDVSGIKYEPIKTISEIKSEISELSRTITELEKTLKVVEDYNKQKGKAEGLQDKIDKIKKNIEKIKLKEPNEKRVTELSQQVTELELNFDKKNDALKSIKNQIETKRKEIKDLNKLITDSQKTINGLNSYNEEFNSVEIVAIECEIQPIADLSHFIKVLRKNINELSELRISKTNKFNELKLKLNRNNYSDEEQFLKIVGDEIDSVHIREKSKDELLRNISEQIIDPVFQFLKEYNDFKEHFIKSFNKKIADYPISKIQELKIIINDNTLLKNDLNLITKVRKLNIGQLQFDTDDKEQQLGLSKLDEYLDTSKSRMYNFSELFGISIKVTNQDGTQKEINLQKQNESTGTIRMINLIVFLLIIKYFKTDKADNKVVFFVDELSIDQSNIAELIDFCKENGFISIFAANQQGLGIEKYYFMKPSPENNFKVVLDERHTGKVIKK